MVDSEEDEDDYNHRVAHCSCAFNLKSNNQPSTVNEPSRAKQPLVVAAAIADIAPLVATTLLKLHDNKIGNG